MNFDTYSRLKNLLVQYGLLSENFGMALAQKDYESTYNYKKVIEDIKDELMDYLNDEYLKDIENYE